MEVETKNRSHIFVVEIVRMFAENIESVEIGEQYCSITSATQQVMICCKSSVCGVKMI